MSIPKVAALLFFCTIFFISGASAQKSVPRFESGTCAVPVPETEKNVTCGYLIVAENRAARNGKTISLPVIILKTSSADPKPDPVLKTLGGPGASSLRMIRGRMSSPWLSQRDYIIFEQRGTRYASRPLIVPRLMKQIQRARKTGSTGKSPGRARSLRHEPAMTDWSAPGSILARIIVPKVQRISKTFAAC